MRMEIEDIYPLSPMQQGMLFHDLYAPDTGLYVERLRYRIEGHLNIPAFQRAWQTLADRHPVLRSAFLWEDVDEPLQVVLHRVELPVELHDWRGLSPQTQQEQLEVQLEAARSCGFELSQAPLMRLALIQMSDRLYQFLWSYHHVLLDGWSVSQLLGELIQLYEAYCRGETPRPEKRRPYRDYIAWLRAQDPAEAEAFWRKTLEGFTSPTPLGISGGAPGAPTRPGQQDYAFRQIRLSKDTAGQFEAFARQHRLTLNTLVQGAWALLLSRYSGEADVVFGAVVSGRPPDLPGAESIVGMFINTLPVRARVEPQARLVEWLEELQARQLEARRFEYNPLVKIQQWSGVPTGQPLFESIVVFENPTLGVRLGQRDESAEIRDSAHYATATGYPLTVVIEPVPDGMSLGISYDARRFDADSVTRILHHLQNLLQGMAADPRQTLAALPLLTEAERHRAVVEWNQTDTELAGPRCLHRLFEAQAERTPDAVAVEFEDRQLTYRELNRRANQLARHLRSLGVGPEVRIGICLDRSLEVAVAILGVLKAGAAYVPLDPAYPTERLRLMLDDVAAPVLLTEKRLAERILPRLTAAASPSASPRAQPEVLLLDADWPVISGHRGDNLADGADADQAAYVIYTSGSTGRPKGVVVSHGAVANHMLWLRDYLELTGDDHYLQKTALSFDASVTEFIAPLITGGRLVVARPGGHQDPAYLARMIAEHDVTVFQTVPSLLRMLLEQPEIASCCALRSVICAGETLPVELKNRFFEWLDAELHNLYGPTEAAVDVTAWACRREDDRLTVPVGRPLANTQIYLLGADRQPVPVGVAGELYIGGAGLARGYHGQPALTAERFVPDPFAPPARAGQRLYRSGDLARYLPDGNIDYLGRVDHQVKVRGFRIELGEIEAVLSQHPAVKESVVVVREEMSGHKRLVAYLASGDKESLSIAELREFLKSKLPDYMVPSAFVTLEALPRTPHGKIDRRWLPAPEETRTGLTQDYVAPRTPVEAQLAQIWSQVLGVKEVGLHDNFFELGGDSILSLQVVGKAGQAGLRLAPRHLFQYPTIAELAAVSQQAPAIQAEQGLVAGPVPLTPVQHWFFEQQRADPEHYNHALLLEVRQALDFSRLEKAFYQLLVHHDALRLRFVQTGSGWQQSAAALADAVPIAKIDLSALPEAAQPAALEAAAAGLQASLNLARGPVLRVAVFDLGPHKPPRVLIIIHHLVVDGVSWRILLEDLMKGYEQLRQGQPVTLPPKTTSFKQWAKRLVEYAQSAELAEELDYWLAADRAAPAPLPVDDPDGRRANTVASSRVVSVGLREEETRALLQRVPEAQRTQINDLLLTALVEALAPWTGSRRLLVDLEAHGREELFDDVDLSRTVGWFTAIFPVHLDLRRAAERGEALRAVKEQLRAIPRHGIGYGLLRYLRGDAEMAARLRGLPPAEISFNYLGRFDQVLPESSPFAPAPESPGPSHSPRAQRRYLLEVDAFVSGGRLQLEWRYSENVHRRETIERIAREYTEALRRLIDVCLSGENVACTPADFPLAKLDPSRLDRLLGADRNVEDIYPLSPVQEGMLFHSLMSPESGVYITQVLYRLEGLNVTAVKRAWQMMLDRHAILRTAFDWKQADEPLQIVRRRVDLPLEEDDWRGVPETAQRERLEAFLARDQSRGFRLSEAPLMRMSLFRVADDAYQLVWTYHHLLLDGWSVPLLTREVLHCYQALEDGRDPQLPPARPYRDYIRWLQGQDLSQAETFWRRLLEGFTAPTPLGEDGSPEDSPASPGHCAELVGRLSAEATSALQAFARKHRLTQNTIVQAAWALLLAEYGGSGDVVFGATMSGRPAGLPGADAMVGLFINTLPVRIQVAKDRPLLAWLRAIQDQQAELRQYENTPLPLVQKWSEAAQDRPLFESIVVFENFPLDGANEFAGQGGGRFVNTEFIIRNSYPLTLRAVPRSEMELIILYDTGRFRETGMARRMRQLETLLERMADGPEAPVAELLEALAETGRQHERVRQQEFQKSRLAKLKDARRKSLSASPWEAEGKP